MKKLSQFMCLLFVFTLLNACSNHILKTNAAVVSGPQEDYWQGDTVAKLHAAAKLIEISYLEPDRAIEKFKSGGWDVTYFAAESETWYSWDNYPEVYLLSRPDTDQLVSIFVGTNSAEDWIENIKTNIFWDTGKKNAVYIPPGHAGYRRGVMNLSHGEFFTKHLPGHVEKYMDSNKVISIQVLGHSQGGGIAQLIAPALDGHIYKKKKVKGKRDNWKLSVDTIYIFGAPYAVSKRHSDWHALSETYGDRTYVVLKDSDMVASAYDAMSYETKVPFRHFGKLVRISRDNQISIEDTKWGEDTLFGDEPHAIKGYAHALSIQCQEDCN